MRREPVDGREPDEPAADRSLTDERDRSRVAGGKGRERRASRAVEARPSVLRARRDGPN